MESNKDIEPLWTVVANIVRERPFGPGGQEVKMGTNTFSSGTKVYIIDWFAGMCQDIIVVGLSRKPKKSIKMVIKADFVEHLRVKLCYDPLVIEKIKEHYSNNNYISRLTKEFAEEMCQGIPFWQAGMKKT